MGKPAVLIVLGMFSLMHGLEAQYPGQYPPGQSPGRYPGGQSPGQTPAGGSGIPVPWGKKKGKTKTDSQPTFSAEGETASNDGKQLVIHTKDGREITLALNPQTKYTKSGTDIAAKQIVPRTTVHVDASEDGEANLTAVKVDLLKDAPAEAADNDEPKAPEPRREPAA